MTTVDRPDVHAIAIEGTFDDCQDIVKALFDDLAFRDELRALRRQFDQLGAHPRADRLLFHRRRRARRAGSADVLRRADRQFRRRARRLLRQAHGAADRAPDRRDQRERHSRARRSPAASTSRRASSRRNRRRWTSRCPRISSGCCSRPMAATPSAVRALMGALDQRRRIRDRARGARAHPRRFRRCPRSRARLRGGDGAASIARAA